MVRVVFLEAAPLQAIAADRGDPWTHEPDDHRPLCAPRRAGGGYRDDAGVGVELLAMVAALDLACRTSIQRQRKEACARPGRCRSCLSKRRGGEERWARGS